MSNTITVTFTDDILPSVGDTITLTQINNLGQEQDIVFTWVDTVPNEFEMRLLLPASTELNNSSFYFTAFSLNSSLYSVERPTPNTTLITALNDEFAFNNAVSTFDYVEFDVEFTPFTGGLKRIHARSPYFISALVFDGTEVKTITSAKFDIYIYEGVLDTSKPSTPTYTYEKKPRYANDTNIYIDISRQISDYIDNKYNGTLQTDCVFVEIDVTSTYSGGTIEDNKKFLALNGYNLHEQNVNHIPTESALLSNSTISVIYGESINIPIYLGSTENYSIALYDGNELIEDRNVQGKEIINTNDIVDFATFDNVIRGNRIAIFFINSSSSTKFYDVEVVTECIYDPVKITFVNRFGVLQDFNCYKVSKETIKATNDSYNRSILKEDLIGGLPVLSYQPTEHRKREYNRQATKSIELNTGYIAEDNNVIIEEMLTSEYIWLTIDGVVIPANLSTKSVPLLTRINDQLIKYKLNFDFSYNEVQNIR